MCSAYLPDPSASIVLHPDPQSVAMARRFVVASLAGSGVDSDIAALIVSEIACNAVLHARSDYEVRVRVLEKVARVEVTDENIRAPQPAPRMLDATSGYGLQLVDALANSWGVLSDPAGKTVFFEMNRTIAGPGD